MSAYSDAVLADSPLLYLRLDETSGTSCANAGSLGGNATCHGAITRNVPAPHANLGVAISCAGTSASDYIDYPDTAALDITGDVTYECWANIDGFKTVNYLMSKGSDGGVGGGYGLVIWNTGAVSVWRTGASEIFRVSSPLVTDTGGWYHIAFTRSGTTYTIYINGAPAATTTSSTTIDATARPFNIGRLDAGSSGTNWGFQGQIDEVAVYNTALSAARIAAHYAAYTVVVVPPPPDPPGVSIAFTDNWDVPNPTWTRIDNVAGRRVRGYTIDRGRPNEFEKTGTGTATIRIADTIGTFDPTDPAEISNVAPGRQANISLWNPTNSTWHTIFRGYVESWRYVLDQTRKLMEIELTLTDGFAILSRYELVPLVDGVLPPYTGTPDKVKLADMAKGNVLYGETVGTVGDRILAVLGDAGWPAALATNWISFPAGTIPDVFSGNVRIGPKAYAAGTSALDALWDAADGEMPGLGLVFMSRDGHFRFRGRQARFRPTVAQYGIVARPAGDPSAWAADATHTVVPIAELEFSHGEDNLYNSCTATPQGVGTGAAWRQYNPDPPDNDNPATQTATAPTSIAAYGLRGLTFDNLQTIEGKATGNNSKVETALFAAYYVQNYADPHPRISRLVFKTRAPTAQNAGALWELFSNCEISDLLSVVTDHPGAGGFSADFFVEGLHYQVTPGPPEHAVVELSLDVSPRAHWTTNPFSADTDPA